MASFFVVSGGVAREQQQRYSEDMSLLELSPQFGKSCTGREEGHTYLGSPERECRRPHPASGLVVVGGDKPVEEVICGQWVRAKPVMEG